MAKSYSDWFKIDLHIHTDKSKETKEGDYKGAFSIDTLKSKLKENGVKIFSLTDHNIINVEAYREYYSKYNDKEDPLLLLGMELDIQGSTKTYHSLLVFNHCDIKSVEEISGKIEQKYTEKSISDKKQRTLDFKDIVDMFEKEDFFFIPHAGDANKNIVSGNRNSIPETQRMLILMQSALEKVTKDEIIKHYQIGFDKMLTPEFQGREDIAYITFSDNHCCDKYPKSHFGENDFSLYYIKGTKSFESIRLAFIDPQSRIKSPDEFRKINQTNNIIENIKIQKNREIEETELSFSPHLNAIIGGRSSGKSLLMWMMGKKIDGISSSKNYENVELDKVKLKSKNDNDLKDCVSLGTSYLYLEQGDIIRYFEEKKLSELADKAGKKEDYIQARKELIDKKLELASLIDMLTNAYETAYSNSDNQFVFHKRVVDNLISNKDCVIKFDSSKLFLATKPYDDANNLLDTTLSNLDDIKTNPIIKVTEEEKITLENTESILKNKKSFIDKRLKKIRTKNRLIKYMSDVIEELNSSLNESAKQKIADRKTIDNIVNNIGDKFSTMRRLKKHSYDIENYQYTDKRNIKMDDITLVISIASELTIKNEILDGINEADYNESLFFNLCNLLNSKKDQCVLKNFRDKTPSNLKKKINTLMYEVYNIIENPIDYLEYNDGSNSSGKSPGYNSEQYIKIVLNNPEIKIIFIDQPEDNLGNQFLSNELVKLIRDIKYQKQIFLVTHNPSIVIYGDAESIILAENNKNSISYRQLFLEDKASQETICNVLDGGRYIFNNRAQKYNIHRLNIENNGKTLPN